MEYILILLALGLIYVIYKIILSIKNTRMTFDDTRFRQAGVEISFANRTIQIGSYTYSVDQVTGIRSEENARGSVVWNAIIEVDDFRHPRHKIHLMNRVQASKFTQRLSTALRKSGGPSFS